MIQGLDRQGSLWRQREHGADRACPLPSLHLMANVRRWFNVTGDMTGAQECWTEKSF